MKKDLNSILENIRKDISKASNREIKELFNDLKVCLYKYDNDPILKNIFDWLKTRFKSKRECCAYILCDIVEEINKPEFTRREELRQDLFEISNIHRGLFENIISLIRWS